MIQKNGQEGKKEPKGVGRVRTMRLLYPDFVSGGLETYYFGAVLLQHILPQNGNQALYKVKSLRRPGKTSPKGHRLNLPAAGTGTSYPRPDTGSMAPRAAVSRSSAELLVGFNPSM